MNEIEAIKAKLALAKGIEDIIECCKEWRDVIEKHDKPNKRLRKYQIPLSNKMIDYVISEGILGNEIATLWARQSGKTEVVAKTVLVLGTFYIIFLSEVLKCGLFAPVESMITHVTRNRLREIYKRIGKFLVREANINQIAGQGLTSSMFVLECLTTREEFHVRSLSVGERAETIGETFGLMIIEQSELVNSMKMKNDVFPMGAEKGGVRVLTGTTSPYFKNEYFKQAIDRYNEDPEKNQSTADYISVVGWKTAAKYSKAYRRYVERERKKLGEDSLEFKTQYGLQWVKTALKFIGWEDLASLEMDYTWDVERLRFVGIDVAQAGDSTVVTVIEIDGTDVHIIAWLELEGIDYEIQAKKKIPPFLRQFKPIRYALVDIVSLGKPVFDMLKKELTEEGEHGKPVYWCRLDGYYGSAPKNHLVNQAMDREFQHERVHFPKHTRYRREKNRFIDQMLDLERKYIGDKLKLEHPNIRGRHDDYPKSLAYAIYAFKDKSFKAGVAHVKI